MEGILKSGVVLLMTTTTAIPTTFGPTFFGGKNGTWQEEFFDNIAYCQDQSDVDQYVLK
ncbi:MAG: hypothetical protein ACJAZR_002592 [Sediminicola sp.]|jgi:hypothetical protein